MCQKVGGGGGRHASDADSYKYYPCNSVSHAIMNGTIKIFKAYDVRVVF